jgi:superfamily I DNA/RNA helicase
LILGPPGSGKTNLLLLRAAYLHQKGLKNLVVLAFGRVLKEFLASGSDHYPFASDKIQTYVKWGVTLLQENGVKLDEPNFDALRASLLQKLSALADLEKPENKFDCILLDEAQDYSPAEINVISRFTTRLFAVGDRKQRILSEEDGALDELQGQGVTVSALSAHYRNGMYVCRVADGIQNLIDQPDGLEATSNYDEEDFPSTVSVSAGLNIEEQVAQAVELIKDQLDAYPDEFIGVLCPRKKELGLIADYIMNSSISDLVQVQKDDDYAAIQEDRRVIVASIHGAKGLEFRAAHLLGMNFVKNFGPFQKKMSYTAVTRCKTSLSVYHDDPLPGYFEKGVQACSAPPAEPSLDDLFG